MPVRSGYAAAGWFRRLSRSCRVTRTGTNVRRDVGQPPRRRGALAADQVSADVRELPVQRVHGVVEPL
ncbi:MAG: hypothetical protein ACXV5Q_17365, partial [Frankiaceae bacterium]